jgi:allantoate deiminase
MVDGERLWRRLSELAEIGKRESGGVTRLSFTDEEWSAKDLVASFMQEAGLAVSEDAVGNLFGRREGSDPNAPAVLVGSHVDSVYDGGNFDGPLGVLAGIEVAQAMEEGGVETDHPVEVVAFTDEEGARFSFGMIGSRALAGTLSEGDLQHQDADGISIADAMRKCDLDPARIGEAARPRDSLACYLELHIEQGRVLEDEDLPVGVVTGIAAPVWRKVVFEGGTGHAGTAPMQLRRDALAAAAEVVGIVEEEASATGTSVGTVGQLGVEPGGINIIPGRVEISLDLRDIDEDKRNQIEERILERSRRVCEGRGVGFETEVLQRMTPVSCSETVRGTIQAACEGLGLGTRNLASGAAHDGMQLAGLCPVGMVFVRSREGVSHSPDEWSSKKDCVVGADVLYHATLDLASRHR